MRKIAFLIVAIVLGLNVGYCQIDYQQIEKLQMEEFQQIDDYQKMQEFQQLENYQKATTDGFFESNYQQYRESSDWGVMPVLPSSHGLGYDVAAEAPLGSGLLLLVGMGLGYVTISRRKQ